MKPLIVLLSVFFIGLIIRAFYKKGSIEISYIARIAMCVMLIFTGISHFIFTKGMSKMLPINTEVAQILIYLTGVIEIVLGILLLNRRFYKTVGIILIVFLILVLPANIYAAINGINPLTGMHDGPEATYLWFRIPLQILFIGWIYFSTQRLAEKN